MQWSDGTNAGFSSADPDRLYLPVDPDPARPTVADQLEQPDSLLHLVRRLIALRAEHADLRGRATTRVLHAGYPFAYLRGERHLVVVNPRAAAASVDLVIAPGAELLLGEGARVNGTSVEIDGFGFGVWLLSA
jgi:maltose alpha-D-glucosyltransferase/alpha-amylase